MYRYVVSRLRASEWMHVHDDLAEEVLVALAHNGISYAVMLTTPRDLVEFALVFPLSEGIIARGLLRHRDRDRAR